MDKIIVYTCITGSYDTLMQPFQAPEDFEFICFVQKGAKKQDYSGVWKIEEIPFEWEDMTLLARSQKLNPHTCLPEEIRWSLWLDGNVRITGDSVYKLCRQLRDRDVKFAGVRHPFNDCPYREALKCLVDRRERLGKLLRVVTFLRRGGVQEHAGLMETNMIFRKHNDPAVVTFDRWWWECLVHLSNRDQLTQTFALMDTPELEWEYMLPEGSSTRNWEGLEYVPHPAAASSSSAASSSPSAGSSSAIASSGSASSASASSVGSSAAGSSASASAASSSAAFAAWWQRKKKYGLNKPQALILKSWIWASRFLVRRKQPC